LKKSSDKKKMTVRKEVEEAEKRIRSHIRETPVEHSPYLSKLGNCEVFLKLENTQFSGSFKLRGAMNKLLSLSREEIAQGVVTASSGNHGAAFAYVLKKFHWKGCVYLPETASKAKVETLRLYDTEVRFYGDDCVKSEMFAKAEAEKTGQVFISPYNDLKIIGGQGTVAVELARQLHSMDAVLVPVGGGGLASGMGGYFKSFDSGPKIIGCQPQNSDVMFRSIKAGRILDMPSKPTLSDGTAGGIEKGAITFDICREVVDDFILVSEDEIKDAIRLIVEKHGLLIEGSAALSVASFIKERKRFKNQCVVLILSGAKISVDQLKKVLG